MEHIRLAPTDQRLARELFAMMARVFDEPADELPPEYLERLLARPDFWAVAAVDGGAVVGGITAHALPMTRTASTELFIYDVAVRRDRQRQGVGRRLLAYLLDAAAAAGIATAFVPAENEDEHAIEFYRAVGGTPASVTFFTFESSDGAADDARGSG